MRKYFSENEIKILVADFEAGTIARADWHHAEHLTVALVYLSQNDFETALAKMRGGLFNLLRSFGVDLTKEMPYHETLTVFWLRAVDEFRNSKRGAPPVEVCNALAAHFDKDYPLRFYTPELLFSDEARARFVEADLANDKTGGAAN